MTGHVVGADTRRSAESGEYHPILLGKEKMVFAGGEAAANWVGNGQ